MVANDITPAVMNAATPEAAATLYRKMAVVMGTVTRLAKTGKNPHFGYTFATAQDVADAIRSALAEQGVAFFVSMYNVRQKSVTRKGQKGERQLIRTKATFSFTFACGDTGATYTSAWEAEAEDDGDKGINKCATAAEKYFLMKTFIMSAGDEVDADGDKPTHNPKPRQQSAPATANGHETGAERPANGKAWYTSPVNIDAVQKATGMSLRDSLKLLGLGNPTEFVGDLDKFVAAVKTKQQPAVTTASGEPVDPATGEILDAPPSAPENANSAVKSAAPAPGYKAAVKRAAKSPVPFPPPNVAKTLEEVPVNKNVDLSRAPE